MINFKQITFTEAMQMISDKQLNKLYFMRQGDLVPAKNYTMDLCHLHEKDWFKKEE